MVEKIPEQYQVKEYGRAEISKLKAERVRKVYGALIVERLDTLRTSAGNNMAETRPGINDGDRP